ncbi:hypothetical protein Q5X59_02655 [Acinetobacter baumannii]|nr:hypothetical protein [Acinetobacter baumannii]
MTDASHCPETGAAGFDFWCASDMRTRSNNIRDGKEMISVTKTIKLNKEKVLYRLEKFESAIRNHENIGSQHPEDHAAIEHEYQVAKNEMLEIINSIFKAAK